MKQYLVLAVVVIAVMAVVNRVPAIGNIVYPKAA